MSERRSQVLNVFRLLHRVRKQVFAEDENLLRLIRTKINDEFRKNQQEQDPVKITNFVKLANEVAIELKKNVMQAEYKGDNVYRLKIRKDHLRDNNELCETGKSGNDDCSRKK